MNQVIKDILIKLTNQGFKAYVVGGYVRDYLRGVESLDVDICTNASPIKLQAIFNIKTNDFGAIHFFKDKYTFTITPFRMEKDYINHKPKYIEFIDDLDKDLLRRDFTINTICMDEKGCIIDLLKGREDFELKKIKSVGDAFFKIKEDPVRILRAIRFSTVLDFDIDLNIKEAILRYGYLLKSVSKYRIKEEMNKILSSINYKKGLDLLKEYNLLSFMDLNYEEVKYVSNLDGMWAQIDFRDDYPFTKKEKDNIVKLREMREED